MTTSEIGFIVLALVNGLSASVILVLANPKEKFITYIAIVIFCFFPVLALATYASYLIWKNLEDARKKRNAKFIEKFTKKDEEPKHE